MVLDNLPTMFVARQVISAPREKDIASAVGREFAQLELARRIRPGETVALTAGSRGISEISAILRAMVLCLREMGAQPFLVPAMGSHGGGTAEGQLAVLAGYGITEASISAPIRASMDVVEVGRHPMGGPIFVDRIASEADHIGIVARIKPHTGFSGSIESGLVKMMMIGLGKHAGAKEYHRVLLRAPWEPFARSVAQTILDRLPVRFGLGIVENARDETLLVEGVGPEAFLSREPELLSIARANMPRLPFEEIDLLIIDRIGKDISGSGADTNVIGRKPAGDWNDRGAGTSGPRITRIFVRSLSDATGGNAAGIGLADFTTDRVVASMDYSMTVINCLTANHPLAAAIPVHFASDREVIDNALRTVGLENPQDAKIVWIQDTLNVEEFVASSPLNLDLAEPAVEVVRALPWRFDQSGNLVSWRTPVD